MKSTLERDELAAAVEHLPPEQRAAIVLWGLANAVVTFVLYPAVAACAIVSAARVWGRRRAGWAVALRTGVPRRATASLLAAVAAHEAARRRVAGELSRMIVAADPAAATGEHAPPGSPPEPPDGTTPGR